MNTDPKNLKNRALELWLQSRHERLPEETMGFVDEILASDSEAASEAQALGRMLDDLAPARVPFREHHRQALRTRLGELVRQDVLGREGPARLPLLQRLGAFFLGGRELPARPRLILVRALALGLGVLVALVIFHARPGQADCGRMGPAEAIAEHLEAPGR